MGKGPEIVALLTLVSLPVRQSAEGLGQTHQQTDCRHKRPVHERYDSDLNSSRAICIDDI